jgi:geranylgeranyl diphosphate synthase type II
MIYTRSDLEKKINNAIDEIQWNLSPQNLYDPIRYVLSGGGKKLRPILTLMATNLFNDDIDLSIPPAIGIEIFHNFTLLHDDLMDRADMRRGNPTVHKIWGNNAAILSGDAMLIQAYMYIANVPINVLPEVLSVFSKTAMEVCQGQQYDMDFEKKNGCDGSRIYGNDSTKNCGSDCMFFKNRRNNGKGIGKRFRPFVSVWD